VEERRPPLPNVQQLKGVLTWVACRHCHAHALLVERKNLAAAPAGTAACHVIAPAFRSVPSSWPMLASCRLRSHLEGAGPSACHGNVQEQVGRRDVTRTRTYESYCRTPLTKHQHSRSYSTSSVTICPWGRLHTSWTRCPRCFAQHWLFFEETALTLPPKRCGCCLVAVRWASARSSSFLVSFASLDHRCCAAPPPRSTCSPPGRYNPPPALYLPGCQPPASQFAAPFIIAAPSPLPVHH